jgi:ATP-dependent Zn protease
MARKPTKALQSTAYHEAAHAVVARCCGIAVYSISIIPDHEENSAGHVATQNLMHNKHLDVETEPKNRMRMERMVIQILAGSIAEEMFNPEDFNHDNSESDYRGAVTLIEYFCGSQEEIEAYLKFLDIRTQNLLNDPYIWEQIEKLADILLEKKKLSAKEVRELFKNKPLNNY